MNYSRLIFFTGIIMLSCGQKEEGAVTSKDVSSSTGMINNKVRCILGVGISDLNGDGWPDIYVKMIFLEKTNFI
jgi:hypothetical protein